MLMHEHHEREAAARKGRFTKRQKNLIHQLFSRKKWRWVQKLFFVRRVHHPRWSLGWAFPKTDMAYFEEYGWKEVKPGSYHDSTTSGVY